jgi:N-ethylmaleimide reductase
MENKSDLNIHVGDANLFSPLKIGAVSLSHRVVMAPLTRLRTEKHGAPGNLMVEYYKQRASKGGLIITESTEITPFGSTYPGAPGIYGEDQIAGWKKVVEAVHTKGGAIFLQLFHGGRTAHPDNLPGGVDPVAPSAILVDGTAFTPTGPKPFVLPRALDLEEIAGVIDDYVQAAKNALAAGFDGVEILGAGGYLLDEFLEDGSNHRTDIYGGSIENRARLLLEVTDAVVSVLGADRVAVRLTPDGKFNGMFDSNPERTFGYIADQLNQFGLAYLHIVEPRIKGSEEVNEGLPPVASEQLRKIFKGIIISAGGFQPESAEAIIQNGHTDLVAFGRHFIANPDLPERIKNGLTLNAYDRSTFYGGADQGYVDYPFFEDLEVIPISSAATAKSID